MSNKNLIHVLDKKLALHQAPEGFRTSMDSVMLGAACPAQSNQSILDLGCGVGSAGICAIYRAGNTTLTGIDIQSDHIEIAQKNAAANHMEDRTEFMAADIRDAKLGNIFEHVICNPPYREAGAHIESPHAAKARAMGHIDEDMSLSSWISCAHHHIKGQGSLTMIHDAGQTDNIIHALYGRSGGKMFGGVEIFPLYPKQGIAAKRVIIRAWKHKKSPAILHQGIIMHESNGDYTKQADRILRDAEKLF